MRKEARYGWVSGWVERERERGEGERGREKEREGEREREGGWINKEANKKITG